MRTTLCLSFILLLGALTSASASSLYGIITSVSANNTQTVDYTVEIDINSGNLTTLAAIFDNIGDSATYDGISAFDQKNQVLYFATDYGSSFVFAIDVSGRLIRPPVATGAESVTDIVYDSGNQQMLFTALYNGTAGVISYPSSPSASSELVFNFTTAGIEDIDGILSAAVNPLKDMYHFVYLKGSTLQMGNFSLSGGQKTYKSGAFPCGSTAIPISLAYDSKLGMFVGISTAIKNNAYYYFQIQGGTCTQHPINIDGIVTCVTYDPTVSSLYFGYATDSGNFLRIYDITSRKFVEHSMTYVLEDLEVAYTM